MDERSFREPSPAQGPTRLVIFPCNGNGIEALGCLGPHWQCVAFVDDEVSKQGTVVHDIPVLSREGLARHGDASMLAVPGSAQTFRERRRAIESLGLSLDRFATVVHSRAWISPLASLGRNVLVMAGVVITSNAIVGDHVCILPNTVIHHDALIGPWSIVGANVTIAGRTRVGSNCYVGSGSTLMNDITIGDGAVVGLGSNVIRDVPVGSRVAGNPARLLG